MRTKSKWFTRGRARAPEQIATVIAVTIWKLAVNTINSMRTAKFDIETGPHYFDFLREYTVFLAHVADRIAYQEFDEQGRLEFTTKVATRLAEMSSENQVELLGGDVAALRRAFVDLFNERGADYAEFGWDDKDGPDFAFVRYCGSRLLELLPPKDHSWVIDQVQAIEAPDAVKTLRAAFANVFATAAPAE